MKKTRDQSGEASPGQQSADYVVGQVSGSLFQSSAASGSALSSLFSAAPPAAALLFQPPPKPVQRSAEAQEPAEVKGQSTKKKKKTLREKSEADQKLENREMSLQNADEDERTKETPAAKKKKKVTKTSEENEAERWVMKRQEQRARKEEEVTKRKRTVFVGNLPVGCTRKTLQSLFRDHGAIESVRFRSVVREDPNMSRKVAVIQRKVHPKKQSMNAYVVFRDEAGVAGALQMNGLEIQKDFHIRVDRVSDGTAHDHKRSVFAGNLSFEISDLAFRRHFEECGSVEAVRLVRDQNSGLGKGFGYVLFENADAVQLALKLDGSKLEGRAVRVKRSMKKEKLKNKTDGKAAAGRAGTRGPGQERGGRKAPRKLCGSKQPRSSAGAFKGEMVDPQKKSKKKGLKKKPRLNRSVHV